MYVSALNFVPNQKILGDAYFQYIIMYSGIQLRNWSFKCPRIFIPIESNQNNMLLPPVGIN